MRLKCNCGTESKEHKYTGNVGLEEERSGFRFVYFNDAGSTYICEDCYKKCEKLMKQMYDILQNKEIYAYQFLPKEEKNV